MKRCIMDAPLVQINQGKLRGFVAKTVEGGEYLAFHGIPYAEPPVGDLRFKEPKPAKGWTGVKDATNYGPVAPQFNFLANTYSVEENCLYLHVSTNSLKGKKAVMVWIHGGGFVVGSPDGTAYGPDYLMKHDIVFVSITYRLGCLGFLNLDLPEAAGNQGLKDQVLALKWIRENIHAFGGDPDNVTIFGESAGGASVHYLTLSPLAKGLFHKAIIQSGVTMNTWAFNEKPTQPALTLIEMMGKKVKDPKEAYKFLMNAPVKDIIEAQNKMKIGSLGFELSFEFVPSIDSKSSQIFMPEFPWDFMKRGVDVPLIIGYTSNEGLLFITGEELADLMTKEKNDFPRALTNDLKFWKKEKVAKVASAVEKFYFGDWILSEREEKQKWSHLKGDIAFINGIQEAADIQIDKSTPTYLYRYSYIASYPTLKKFLNIDLEGTCHGDDIGALFHSTLLSQNEAYKIEPNDRLHIEKMTVMWTNFAKTGNPTPELNNLIPTKWKALKKGEKNYLEINSDLKTGVNPDNESWTFWKNIMKNLK